MSSNQKSYFIGEIAKELDLSTRAIRYYEELGLIKPTRTEGGFRTYSECDVNILRVVLNFKGLGMSLEDIRALLLPAGDARAPEVARRLREALSAKRGEFEARLERYKDGIAEIDRMLEMLENCGSCGRPTDKVVCEECLNEHGGRGLPLIHSLLAGAHG